MPREAVEEAKKAQIYPGDEISGGWLAWLEFARATKIVFPI
jgi:hypothetical protein